MATDKVKRKLTAILSADVKGYSRLMGEDEEWTLRTLNTYKEVMGSLIQQYRGRIVGTAGDSVLAEFASVVDAVQCGVEIQQVLRARNALLPETRRMEFRIGINLGDVIEEGDTIYGDGVNIAARLESIAEAGGICISESAYQQIENKLPLRYDYLGEHKVKNIAKPVRVYRARIEPEATPSRPPAKVAVKGKTAFPLPDKPSIAVLAFTNMSDDPKQEYFADGLAEEIINGLCKCSDIFVIARNSTFTYKGKPVNVQQVAEEMGVRYVLEGSVRREGNRVRITAQLIDAATGNHVFSERYDLELKNIFAIQDEITMKVLTAMQVKLTRGEQARMMAKGTKNLEAYLKVLQAWKHWQIQNKESVAQARQMAEEAIILDPEYAVAYSLVAVAIGSEVVLGAYKNPKEALERAMRLAQKAVAIDDSLGQAHLILGYISIMLNRDYEKGIAEVERAVVLEPNSADAYTQLAIHLHWAGHPKEAIPFFKKAILLAPIPTWPCLQNMGSAYMRLGQYDEAIAIYKRIIQKEPDQVLTHVCLASALMQAGRKEEARAEATEVMRIDPKFSLERNVKFPWKNQKDLVRCVLEPARKAGLK